MAEIVQLGDRIRDRISGVEGIAVARTEYLYGCTRIGVQPESHKDGKPAAWASIDEPQCEVVKPAAVPGWAETVAAATSEPTRRSGPRTDVDRSPDVVSR